ADRQELVAARDPGDVAQVSSRRSDRTECRSTRGFEDERCRLALTGLNGIVELLSEPVTAFCATVGAMVRAAIRIRRVDLDGITQHRQVDLAPEKVPTHRHGAEGRAVITLAAADDAMPRALADLDLILARELQRGLHRLRAPAGEEN